MQVIILSIQKWRIHTFLTQNNNPSAYFAIANISDLIPVWVLAYEHSIAYAELSFVPHMNSVWVTYVMGIKCQCYN